MPTWVNDDGLVINTGIAEAELGNVAGYRTNGRLRVTEIVLNWEDMPAVADGSTILNDKNTLPAGAVIETVRIVDPHDDFVGVGATVNIGWIDADDRTSNADVDAFVVAATIAELNAGGENTAGWVGAGVGTALTQAKLLTWEVDTAALTAGDTTVEIEWYMPKDESDTLVYSK